MKKLTFKQQMILSMVIIALGVISSNILHNGIFSNIAWVITGVIWIIHPVIIHNVETTSKGYNIIRLAGLVLAIWGIVTRFGG